jgi:hypothetical protein
MLKEFRDASLEKSKSVWHFIILKTAVNAGGFAQFFGRLRLARYAPRTARCASGKRKPHPPQNLTQTHPAELPFLG